MIPHGPASPRHAVPALPATMPPALLLSAIPSSPVRSCSTCRMTCPSALPYVIYMDANVQAANRQATLGNERKSKSP
jgi:hypothetical protein